MSTLTEKAKNLWLYGISALFLGLNSVFIYNEQYWFALVPAVLIIVLLGLFASNLLLYLIVLATPLSVNLEQLEFGLGVALPTEPLMFGLMIVFFAKILYENQFDSKVFTNPITLAILLNLFWLFICIFPSELPVVSMKAFLSRVWFLVSGYFVASQIFRFEKNLLKFLWLYIVPLAGVIVYTVIRHSTYGFEDKPAHWVMQPFFKDHTSYGAILAMFYPVIIATLFMPKVKPNAKIAVFIVFLIFTIGIILSYTRAAWVSLAGVFVIFILMKLKVNFKVLLLLGAIGLGGVWAFQDEILMKLEKNKQDSSSDLTEHVESISNVASDASNLERINRWSCAVSMFEERPFFGWGFGTYSFLYAPFQQSGNLTIISTNFGDGGNAHSEYLGPLAETGVIGLLTFLLIIGLTLYKGVTLYNKVSNPNLKPLIMGLLLGLITYYVHGILNNFLDIDKASIPFWAFTAMLVVIDVHYKKEHNLTETYK